MVKILSLIIIIIIVFLGIFLLYKRSLPKVNQPPKQEERSSVKYPEGFKRVDLKKETDKYTFNKTFCQNKNTGTEMNLQTAIEIAKIGECGIKGDFTTSSNPYSEHEISVNSECKGFADTVVWWINGYQIKPEFKKDGCYNQSCRVDIEQKEAHVEYFCGDLPVRLHK